MKRYRWNFTQLKYTTWGCVWRRVSQIQYVSREIISCVERVILYNLTHSSSCLSLAIVVSVCVLSALCAQEFQKEPESVRAVSGKTIVLSCIIKNRVGYVQWTRGVFGLGSDPDLPGFDRYSMIGMSPGNGRISLPVYNIWITVCWPE